MFIFPSSFNFVLHLSWLIAISDCQWNPRWNPVLSLYLAFLPPLSLQLLRPSPPPPVCSISPTSIPETPFIPPIPIAVASPHPLPHPPALVMPQTLGSAILIFSTLRACSSLSLSRGCTCVWACVCLSLKHAKGMVHVYIDSLCCRYCPAL